MYCSMLNCTWLHRTALYDLTDDKSESTQWYLLFPQAHVLYTQCTVYIKIPIYRYTLTTYFLLYHLTKMPMQSSVHYQQRMQHDSLLKVKALTQLFYNGKKKPMFYDHLYVWYDWYDWHNKLVVQKSIESNRESYVFLVCAVTLRLCNAWRGKSDGEWTERRNIGPVHIFGASLNLVNPNKLTWRQRTG